MKKDNYFYEPTEDELKEADKIREKVEETMLNLYKAVNHDQNFDRFSVAMAVLIFAQEKIFELKELDQAFVEISKAAIAVHFNEYQMKKKSKRFNEVADFRIDKDIKVH